MNSANNLIDTYNTQKERIAPAQKYNSSDKFERNIKIL